MPRIRFGFMSEDSYSSCKVEVIPQEGTKSKLKVMLYVTIPGRKKDSPLRVLMTQGEAVSLIHELSGAILKT